MPPITSHAGAEEKNLYLVRNHHERARDPVSEAGRYTAGGTQLRSHTCGEIAAVYGRSTEDAADDGSRDCEPANRLARQSLQFKESAPLIGSCESRVKP